MGERAMKMSDAGLAFLIKWEGARSKPYDDGGPGLGNCTVGVGHLIHYGPCTQAELDQPPLSLAEINRLLLADVARFETAVNGVNMALNQNQFDALVDFAFNCGAGAVAGFTGDLSYLRQFIHDGAGNEIQALVDRREAEIQLYETPVEEPMTQAERDEYDGKIAKLYTAIGGNGAKLDDAIGKIDKLAEAVADHAKRLHALDGI